MAKAPEPQADLAAWESRGQALGSIKETLVDRTVDVVMAVRAQYLASGANAIKHWPQITDRMRAATRTTEGPEAWATKIMRDLKLPAPSKDTAAALEALAEFVQRGGERGTRAWLATVEAESMFIIAKAQRLAEERRSERDARAAAAEAEAEKRKAAPAGPGAAGEA